MSQIKDKTVLVTGGASGIGRLMGGMALDEGAKLLIIWDVDSEGLRQTKNDFVKQGRRVETYLVDVRDTNKIIEIFQDINRKFGAVDILINNAGIVVGGEFALNSHDEIDRTMQVNSSALMHIAREALPAMMKQGNGHIVNIASAAGMIANPNMAVYCASKWAVTGWSDSLRLELERSHPGVKVTTVTPYYISTGMFAGVKSSFIPILKPEPTARKIIRAIRADKVFLRLPLLIYFLPLLQGILPTRMFDFFVGRCLGVYKSMDAFEGR